MTQLDLRAKSDAELLTCFATGRDQRAFAQIVARHGPMVMCTARRVLHSEADAEDALQATFLALASGADRLRRKSSLAAWLHQTAVRTAKSIRRANMRWQRKVDRQKEVAGESYSPTTDNGLADVLDEELCRLPATSRAVIVLCDLQGRTRKEAAAELGIPTATVKTRLTRARDLLGKRLVRRGVTLSTSGLLAAMTKHASATQTITTALIQKTTANALHFAAGKSAAEFGVSTAITHAAQGVITAMTATKFSMIGAAALAIVFAATAIGGVANLLSVLKAETVFIDHFDVPSPEAPGRQPVSWSNDFSGAITILDGDFIVGGTGGAGRGVASGLSLQDVSLRTQFAVGTGTPFVQVRLDRNLRPISGYASFLNASGELGIVYSGADPTTRLASAITDLRPNEEEVILQVDAFGRNVDVYAWRPTQPRPNEPTVRFVDEQLIGPGTVAIGVTSGLGGTGPLEGRFRYVHVATSPIPEPSTAMLSSIFFAGVFVWQWRRSR